MTYKRKNKLNVVNIGLKLFCKNKGNQECKVDFRILMEGLDTLLPFMSSKRVIKVPIELFNSFIESKDNYNELSYNELENDAKEESKNKENFLPKNSRLKYAAELINSIRFMCMSAEELADVVEPVEFMKTIPECNTILMNAYRYHA